MTTQAAIKKATQKEIAKQVKRGLTVHQVKQAVSIQFPSTDWTEELLGSIQQMVMTRDIAKIAIKEFHIDSCTVAEQSILEPKNSDSLDFINVAIWEIRSALEAAYKAGQASANTSN